MSMNPSNGHRKSGCGRIESLFRELHQKKKKAFIPYIMAGDPSIEQTMEIVIGLSKLGADLIELGVPFSDPIADGPVIQRASKRSLDRKTTLPGILDMVATLRKTVSVPLVLMSYYNPIMKFGEGKFVKEAINKGVDGVIIPDLPPEEAHILLESAYNSGLDLIFLVAPTTSKARMKRIVPYGRGFLYYVSLVGITGAQMGAVSEIKRQIEGLRKISSLPIAIGFGISTPDDVKRASVLADGVVVGSALVKQIETHLDDGTAVSHVLECAESLMGILQKKY